MNTPIRLPVTHIRSPSRAYSPTGVALAGSRTTPRAIAAVELWRRVEADRKRPWRIVRRLGIGLLIRYALGRLTLGEAIAHLGRKAGLDAAAIPCPYGLAAVDVDKPADLDLVRAIVADPR